jgi:Meiotically up-regulated gene 113
MKYIYLIKSLEEGYYKIGISSRPSRRIEQLQTGNSSELKLINTYQSQHANQIETVLHNRYSHVRKVGEWYELDITQEASFYKDCQKIEENILYLKKSGNVFI